MSMEVHTYSVLLVSASQRINAAIGDAAPRGKFDPVITADNIFTAQRLINERDFDLVIVNSPLPDDSGIRFLLDTSERFGSTVFVLLVRADVYSDIYDKMTAHGVLMLSKPMSQATLTACLQWIETIISRLVTAEKKSLTLEEKMAEIRTVNRAKWLLIEQKGMTETQAHKYIEKLSMDRGAPKTVIAEEILSTEDK